MNTKEEQFLAAVGRAGNRLGFAFPGSFRAVIELAEVETSGWRLWPPDEWTLVSAELSGWDYGGARGAFSESGYVGPDGVVIGGDDGGNVVCLLVKSGTKELEEAVFYWDHDTADFEQLAARVGELPEVLARRAEMMLAEDAPRASYFSRQELATADDVCTFCGSGMQGSTTCLVCSRTSEEAGEQDSSRALASMLLARLLQTKLIELEKQTELDRLCSVLADLFDRHGDAGDVASECCRLLVDDPGVRDLFADDEDVEKLLRELASAAP